MFIQGFEIRIAADQSKDILRFTAAKESKLCVQSVLDTFIVQVFFKNVKGDEE